MKVLTGAAITCICTLADAVFLSLGHVTVTVTGTVPTWFGAVQTVCAAVGFAKLPVGAVHA